MATENKRISGSLTGSGTSGNVIIRGGFNLSLSNTFVGSIDLQRSVDGGITFNLVKIYTDVTQENGVEYMTDTHYRLVANSISGTADYVLGGQ